MLWKDQKLVSLNLKRFPEDTEARELADIVTELFPVREWHQQPVLFFGADEVRKSRYNEGQESHRY